MKKILVTLAVLAGVVGLKADEAVQNESVFQASLTPDIAVHSKTTLINGFAIDIWGQNPQHGLNLGLVNGSTGHSSGFTWGIVNYADSYTGVQWGIVNYSTGDIIGWQHAWVNWSKGSFSGLESGYVNISHDMSGVQIGLVNYAEHLQGVQVGLANIAMNNPWFKELPDKFATGFPIVNWSF